MARATGSKRKPCSAADAKARYKIAEAYLEVARLTMSEKDRPEDYDYNHAAAGIAVLAAIAASDALCCRFLGERSEGQNHRDAIALLATVRFGEGDERQRSRRARSLAESLATAIDLKDSSHYGMSLLGLAEVKKLVRAASRLVEAASEVV